MYSFGARNTTATGVILRFNNAHPPHPFFISLSFVQEAISWSAIDFPDNQECLDLIEAKRPAGLMAILDGKG